MSIASEVTILCEVHRFSFRICDPLRKTDYKYNCIIYAAVYCLMFSVVKVLKVKQPVLTKPQNFNNTLCSK